MHDVGTPWAWYGITALDEMHGPDKIAIRERGIIRMSLY
jgi:hypothetical protein